METRLQKSTLKSEFRRDYEFNHEKVQKVFFEYIAVNNAMPSNVYIAKLTGLSEKTVRNHLREFNLNETADVLKLLGERVLYKLVERILRDGEAAAVKLYFQLVFDWDPKAISKRPPDFKH